MGKSVFQPDHAGRTAPQLPTSTVAHVHDRAHEFEDHKGLNIARAGGKPKGGTVQHHGGMTRQQTAMAGMGGLGHGIGVDANPGRNPLAPEPRGKTFADAKPVPGQRSRINNDDLHGGTVGTNAARAAAKGGNLNHALGRAIIDEALNVADGATRARYGR